MIRTAYLRVYEPEDRIRGYVEHADVPQSVVRVDDQFLYVEPTEEDALRADWNGGLVVLFHRFDLTAFGWDVQYEHHMTPALRMGLDAVHSDDVAMMHSAFRAEFGG